MSQIGNAQQNKKSTLLVQSIYGVAYLGGFFISLAFIIFVLYEPLCTKIGSKNAGGLIAVFAPLVSILIGGLARFLVHHYYVRKKFGPLATELFYGKGSAKYLDKN